MASEYIATVAVALTPHNTTPQPNTTAIYVGAMGDIKVKTKAGTDVTFVGVQGGSILPLAEVDLIYATGTTATSLVGLK